MLTEVVLFFVRTGEIICGAFSVLYQIIFKWRSTFSCLILSEFCYALTFSKISFVIILKGFFFLFSKTNFNVLTFFRAS